MYIRWLGEKPILFESGELVIWKYLTDSYGRKEIGRKIPEAKQYVVYPETVQGTKDLNTDMRRKTRVGRSWQMALGLPCAHNSFFAEIPYSLFRAKEFAYQKPILFKKRDRDVFT